MFQMCLCYCKHIEVENDVEAIAINCSNCRKSTGLFLKVKKVKYIITKFLLNTVLHYVGLYWISSSNKKMEYDIKENNYPGFLNKGSQYNTAICYKLYETVFGDYIRNDRTYRCNIMCSITVHDKLYPSYADDTISISGREIPNNSTAATL